MVVFPLGSTVLLPGEVFGGTELEMEDEVVLVDAGVSGEV